MNKINTKNLQIAFVFDNFVITMQIPHLCKTCGHFNKKECSHENIAQIFKLEQEQSCPMWIPQYKGNPSQLTEIINKIKINTREEHIFNDKNHRTICNNS